jgi:transcriptional regulator, trmB
VGFLDIWKHLEYSVSKKYYYNKRSNIKMEESKLIDGMMQFGLTRQEASIYICLASNRELSGYEVSKITGISRSNVYSALASLVEEGAAYLLEGETSKYTSVDVEEFCKNRIRHMTETMEELVRQMPQLGNNCEGYITISSHKHIMDRIHFMLSHVKYRVYISMPVRFLTVFQDELNRLIEDGRKVVLIINEPIELTGCIIYYTDKKDEQVRLIVDSEYVLTGDMTGNSTDTCLYCGQKNFVNVFKESMKNEIELITLKKD